MTKVVVTLRVTSLPHAQGAAYFSRGPRSPLPAQARCPSRPRRRQTVPPREDGLARYVVDNKDQPAPAVAVGPIVEPFGREHRVLRRLNQSRLIIAVGKGDDAFDPQQIAAASPGKRAQRPREIEPRHRALQHDREGVDAVAMHRRDL